MTEDSDILLQELADGAGVTLAEYKKMLAQHDELIANMEAEWEIADERVMRDRIKYPWKYTHNLGASPVEPIWAAFFHATYNDYDAEGVPTLAYIEAATGQRISAEKRDISWKKFKLEYYGAKPEEEPINEGVRQIADAIEKLVPPQDFTKRGKPRCRALKKILGYAISAVERDEAWTWVRVQGT